MSVIPPILQYYDKEFNDANKRGNPTVQGGNTKIWVLEPLPYTRVNIGSQNVSESKPQIEEIQKTFISIAWIDLKLSVPRTFLSDEKVILKQINGFFEFGTINALMGPSGAGKTTFLNCMNGLYPSYIAKESKIFVSKFKTIKTCFITQNQKDHILTGLTAGQSLIYASKLKNSDKKL